MNLRYKLLWCACALVAISGYTFIYHPYENAIADTNTSRENIAQAIDQNDALLRRRVALEHERHELTVALQSLDLGDDQRTIVALYVRAAAAIASAYHVRITSLDMRDSQQTQEPPANGSSISAFATTPLDLTLVGAYGDLLTTIRALSRARILANVDVASLERSEKPSTGQAPHLSARLHIELKHLLPTGVDHVRIRST
jgi:hypothetical protein